MEINHPEQTAQQDSLNVVGHDKEIYQGTNNFNPANIDKKVAAVHSEIERVSRLPANSSYAVHRMRVLHKILNLTSVHQRSSLQNEELEMLFASLSL